MRMISKNGIDLLLAQHQQVRELLEAVQFGPVEEQQARFDELRELLAVHETAEQIVLRPLTRASVAGGNEIADARIAEENAAKKALAELEKLEVNSYEFIEKFATFKADVLEHAANEEAVEFGVLRAAEDPVDMAQLADRLEQAETAAPTHPHPSAKTTGGNVALGPFAALLDRARDALSRD
jgi:hypothetical protein